MGPFEILCPLPEGVRNADDMGMPPPVLLLCCPRCKQDYYTSTIHICPDKRQGLSADILARIDTYRSHY